MPFWLFPYDYSGSKCPKVSYCFFEGLTLLSQPGISWQQKEIFKRTPVTLSQVFFRHFEVKRTSLKKKKSGLGTMNAYNSSHSGGRDLEDCHLRPAGQKVTETSISTNTLGVVFCDCNPSYAGNIGRRIVI
jgi:hypothetical protein